MPATPGSWRRSTPYRRYIRGYKPRVRFNTMTMIDAVLEGLEIAEQHRARHDARTRSALAELNVFFGTPIQLNTDGQLEVTPQQYALITRWIPPLERPAWEESMRLDGIPIVVIEPPC